MIYLTIIKLGCQSVGSGGVMGIVLHLFIMVACGTVGKKHILQQKLKNTGWFFFHFDIALLWLALIQNPNPDYIYFDSVFIDTFFILFLYSCSDLSLHGCF